MLGIVIGIGTVVLVLGTGEGFKSYINAQVELFGSNTLSIETVIPASTKTRNANQNADTSPNLENNAGNNAVPITTLKNRDIEDIKNIQNVKNAYGAAIGQDIVSYRGTS